MYTGPTMAELGSGHGNGDIHARDETLTVSEYHYTALVIVHPTCSRNSMLTPNLTETWRCAEVKLDFWVGLPRSRDEEVWASSPNVTLY